MLNDFPLPEDGITRIPFMHSYKFNLSNTYLELDGVKHKLHDDGIFVPMNSIKIISMEVEKKNRAVLRLWTT